MSLRIAYFGGEPIGVPVAQELQELGILPELVICNPDRPVGRKQILTPPPIKVWAEKHQIVVWQPESFGDKEQVMEKLAPYDLFVVVAYNKILPAWLIELPKYKTINVHPSLLPELRGPSPIRTALLQNNKETGVSIIKLDEKMDHGPLLAQEKLQIDASNWPMPGQQLDVALARLGGSLLATTIPEWTAGKITPTEQDHTKATYTKKITKDMGEIDLNADPYQNYLKICAFDGWPGTFFFKDLPSQEGESSKKVRVKITKASWSEAGTLEILSVIPEGKKEMPYKQFLAD